MLFITPFKRYKHWIRQGEILLTCYIHWLAAIPKKNNGTFIRKYWFLPDIMAILIELAAIDYQTEYFSQEIYSIEGKCLIPLYNGQE